VSRSEAGVAITFPTLFLGQTLKKTFNRTDRLRELEIRSARVEQYLLMQHTITQIIARSAELESALPRILQAICETADWDFGEVWHVDEEDHHLHCEATWCAPSLRFPGFETSGQHITFAHGKGLPGRVWASNKPAWVTNVVVDRNFMRAPIAEQDGLHGGIAIPIRTEGEVIGALAFFSRELRQPDRELLQVLDTVGSQVGLFVERKRNEQVKWEQARALAALEERQRLARDLHDSVTQTLFSASVIAEMLPILWTNNPEQVKSGLDDLQQLTRDALSEMRSLLVEMRPTVKPCDDLSVMLKELANTLMNRAKIEVTLDVHLLATLPTETQIALYRITQEALNNIHKHAAATQVSVTLFADCTRLELYIEDNGRGFDLASIPSDHFGVGIMAERAEAIGAVCQLESTLGKGTRLSVVRPSSVLERL
jgi:signal transduction histidine kinase